MNPLTIILSILGIVAIAGGVVAYFRRSAGMGYAEVISAGTVVNLYPTPQTTNWTNVNNKGADFQITYEI